MSKLGAGNGRIPFGDSVIRAYCACSKVGLLHRRIKKRGRVTIQHTPTPAFGLLMEVEGGGFVGGPTVFERREYRSDDVTQVPLRKTC